MKDKHATKLEDYSDEVEKDADEFDDEDTYTLAFDDSSELDDDDFDDDDDDDEFSGNWRNQRHKWSRKEDDYLKSTWGGSSR